MKSTGELFHNFDWAFIALLWCHRTWENICSNFKAYCFIICSFNTSLFIALNTVDNVPWLMLNHNSSLLISNSLGLPGMLPCAFVCISILFWILLLLFVLSRAIIYIYCCQVCSNVKIRTKTIAGWSCRIIH